MKHIVIAQPLGIPSALFRRLSKPLEEKGFTFTVFDTVPQDQQELGRRIGDADLLVIANYPLKKEALDCASSLKYICVAFTGVDHVDLDACRARNISVSNCAGYSTQSVAELVFGLILSLLRKIPEGNETVRNGGTSAGLRGQEIGGKTLGIIGTGAIGCRVAEIAKVFGAHVIGFSRSRKSPIISYTDLDTLLRTSDIVTVHLPLNEETRHFLSKEKLSLLKENAVLINTARGGVIDNDALAGLLTEGKIRAAGIDVFDGEPPLPRDTSLLSAPHTVLMPHIGFDTEESMERRAAIVMDNLTSYLEGKQKNIIC